MIKIDADDNANTIKLSIIGIFVISIARILIKIFKANPQIVWDAVDAIGIKYNIKSINSFIMSDQKHIDRRVVREVTDAIDSAKIEIGYEEPEVKSVFTEVKDGETLLGGEMRIQTSYSKNNNE